MEDMIQGILIGFSLTTFTGLTAWALTLVIRMFKNIISRGIK